MPPIPNVRQSAHGRTVGLRLTVSERDCKFCGARIRWAKRDGRWRPVEPKGHVLPNGQTFREEHSCLR